MTTQKRAVLYARVSSDDTGKDGRNLDGQIDMGREYATKRGYSIVDELSEDDKGASGAEIDLPQLNRIRDMARAGKFDVLVVREIDRLSRNLAKQLIVESELKRTGVSIEYVIGEYADTPEGNFMKHVRASVAEFEREKIRERMVRGRRLKVKSGGILTHGRTPYGYLLDESNGQGKLMICEPEARIVRMIYRWYTEGDDATTGKPLSLMSIAIRLNEMGIVSLDQSMEHKLRERRKARGLKIESRKANRRPVSKNWRGDAIAHLLKSETYAGVWHYGKRDYDRKKRAAVFHPKDTLIAVEVPPIITRDEWDAAQARLKESRESRRRQPKRHFLMGGGRLICGCCKGKMIGNGGKENFYYYRCTRRPYNSASPHHVSCSMTQGFRVDHVDVIIWDWIRSFLKDPKSLNHELNISRQEREKKNKPLVERLQVADDLLAENQAQLDRMLDLYQFGESKETKEAVVDRVERLRETVNKLKRERAELSAKLEAQTITAEQIQEIESFAAAMREEIDLADDDFEARQYLITRLHTTATLTIENGEKVAHASCLMGKKTLSLSSQSIYAKLSFSYS